jgi:hypothetical protein
VIDNVGVLELVSDDVGVKLGEQVGEPETDFEDVALKLVDAVIETDDDSDREAEVDVDPEPVSEIDAVNEIDEDGDGVGDGESPQYTM